jgi:hypothetical protein
VFEVKVIALKLRKRQRTGRSEVEDIVVVNAEKCWVSRVFASATSSWSMSDM